MTVSPRDLASLRLVGSPRLAPDGSRAVAVVQSVDPEELTKRTELWSFPFDGEPEALGERSHPAFSPSGELFTVDDSADGPVAGGKVVGAGWIDDERVVAVVERAAPAGEPIVVDWLRFKHDGGPSFVEPTHELWLLGDEPRLLRELDGRVTSLAVGGGAVVYAMVERHSDVPTAPVQVRRWTFDGDELLWACPGQVVGLVLTSLSGTVVVSSSAVAGHSAAPAHLWVVDGDGPRPLFADLECERAVLGDSRPAGKPAVVRSVAGTDDVVFLATVGHDVGLFTGSVDGGTARRLTPEGCTVTDFSAAHQGRVAVCVESPTAPVELFAVSLDGDVKQVSRLNSVEAVGPETVAVGDLHGLLLRADGAGPGPLVVRVHGGPHLAWGTSFNVDDQVL
ncbi:MAG TPA: hypothetical protein VHF06_15445, partial [Pseudonocardiaceae bacterium]|nr:hypothetical protein [Pseudonocardiaceae bacterium]